MSEYSEIQVSSYINNDAKLNDETRAREVKVAKHVAAYKEAQRWFNEAPLNSDEEETALWKMSQLDDEFDDMSAIEQIMVNEAFRA